MFKILTFLLLPFILLSFIPDSVYAQNFKNTKQDFYKGRVIKIIEEGTKKIGSSNNLYQNVQIVLLNGPEKNQTIFVEYGGLYTITNEQKIHTGDEVIISKSVSGKEAQYRISDIYRLNFLYYIIFAFFLLVVVMAGKKGIGSIIGMIISLGVIVLFIIPQILNGGNPLIISLIGSLFIMVSTIYLAHGYSTQTTIAVVSTLICLAFSVTISIILVQISKLSGLGSEDIYTLTQGFGGKINFQGLLLGGIIIGSLGVLDDVTTTQTATIFELSDANPKYGLKTLFVKGMRIGREHITSLVNTLILAYAGASIGIFIFIILAVKQQTQPLWVILNSELIMEEIVRTIAGSTTLIFAVPLTTLIAAFFTKYSLKIKQ